MNFGGKAIWGNSGKRAKSKWERRVSNRWSHIRKRGATVNSLMVDSLDKSSLDFDKQICFCTGLREMFQVNYLRGKYNKCSTAPFMRT